MTHVDVNPAQSRRLPGGPNDREESESCTLALGFAAMHIDDDLAARPQNALLAADLITWPAGSPRLGALFSALIATGTASGDARLLDGTSR